VAAAPDVYWVEFVPCRPDLHGTMKDEEQVLMIGHLKWLEAIQEAGRLEFAGRASDASHGLAIIHVKDEPALTRLLDDNPACKAGVLVPQWKPYLLPKRPGR
jgi:uncharacterized protein YciI